MERETEAALTESETEECGGDIHQTYHLQLGDPWYRAMFYALGIVAAIKYIVWG